MPSGQKMPLLSTASEISTHTCTMYIRNPSPLASLVAQAHFWGSQHPVSKMRRWSLDCSVRQSTSTAGRYILPAVLDLH